MTTACARSGLPGSAHHAALFAAAITHGDVYLGKITKESVDLVEVIVDMVSAVVIF